MFGLDAIDIQRIAVASAGALLLSLISVVSAIGPVASTGF